MDKALSAVRTVYSRGAERYDSRWRDYLELTIDRTARSVAAPAGARLLDVGCGSGLLLDRLLDSDPRLHAVGLDLTPEMLRIASERLGGRATLVAASAGDIPFGAGTFDWVTSTSSLHHWPDPAAALSEIHRVLRPGGSLVLTDWRADHLPTRIRDLVLRVLDRAHHRTLTVAGMKAALRAARFGVDYVESYSLGWTWGLMTLRARAER